MHCERMEQLLSAQLDGALTRAEQQQLQRHLDQCPACRQRRQQLQALHGCFAQLEPLQAPEGFAQGVMEKIRSGEAGKPDVVPFRRRPYGRTLAGLAACAVLCAGLYRGMSTGLQPDAVQAAPAQSAALARAGQEAPAQQAAGAPAAVSFFALEEEAAAEEPAKAANLPRLTAPPREAALSNQRTIPVTYGCTPPAPAARILGTQESLKEFLEQFAQDDLRELEQAYGPDFFETGRLLAVVLEESSSSIGHTLLPEGLNAEQVTVARHVPEERTDDMAAWLILAEVDGSFSDGQTLQVITE